jgi:hypothetical protein
MLSLKKTSTRISPIVLRTLGAARPGFAVRAGGTEKTDYAERRNHHQNIFSK